jgi:Skp family chaperone for outer membrane proteins
VDIDKSIWVYVLLVVLAVALCGLLLFRNGGRNPGHETETIAEQNKRIAEQDARLADQERRLIEQGKGLAEQDKKLAELERIAKKIDAIQAQLNTRKIDIKDDDMALIKEMIEQQVKLNAGPGGAPKIAVISVQEIFKNCKRTANYMKEVVAERERINAEEEKLKAEIDARKDGLKTLKVGSDEYMALMKEVLTKQADLQVRETLHERQRVLKEQQMVEGLYKDILRETEEVAKQKGLDLVFERSIPELPALSPAELEQTMGMHKLLYGGGSLDITKEVMARLDSGQ